MNSSNVVTADPRTGLALAGKALASLLKLAPTRHKIRRAAAACVLPKP
jgi:hypothetical protein